MQCSRKVTKIPAIVNLYTEAPIGATQKRLVAGYARVSTDKDEQFTSYEAQVDYYTRYIKSRSDWEFVKVYTDEGISGTSTKHREGFKKMVSDALAGRINLIVTKSVSRFARNTVDSLSTIRKLKENGIEVYFEKENIWTFDSKGELLITIMSSLAQEESRSISENCTWGQRKRFADGKVSVAYSRFLGYDRGKDGNLIINPTEAQTIKKIFSLFLKGMTPFRIAKKLTDDGDMSPGHKTRWNVGTVERILQNEKYKGDALLQKSYTIDYLTKKTKANNGEVPQYYVEHNHEAIIDADTFDRVQLELAQRKAGNSRCSRVHEFSSKIKCGEYGSWYGSKVWHSNDKYRKTIWRCNHKFGKDEHCSTPNLSEEEIKAAFISAANKVLSAKDAAIANFRKSKDQIYNISSLEQTQSQLIAQLNKATECVQNLVYQNAHTTMDQEEYSREYDRLMAGSNDLKEQLDKVTASIAEMQDQLKTKTFYYDFLENLSAPLKTFDRFTWNSMVEFATVYSRDDIRFTFKDGAEIKS